MIKLCVIKLQQSGIIILIWIWRWRREENSWLTCSNFNEEVWVGLKIPPKPIKGICQRHSCIFTENFPNRFLNYWWQAQIGTRWLTESAKCICYWMKCTFCKIKNYLHCIEFVARKKLWSFVYNANIGSHHVYYHVSGAICVPKIGLCTNQKMVIILLDSRFKSDLTFNRCEISCLILVFSGKYVI